MPSMAMCWHESSAHTPSLSRPLGPSWVSIDTACPFRNTVKLGGSPTLIGLFPASFTTSDSQCRFSLLRLTLGKEKLMLDWVSRATLPVAILPSGLRYLRYPCRSLVLGSSELLSFRFVCVSVFLDTFGVAFGDALPSPFRDVSGFLDPFGLTVRLFVLTVLFPRLNV